MIHTCTLEEKIAEVERLIVEERRLTGRAGSEVLRAIAADLRARLDFRPSVALVDIERRVAAVAHSKSSTGYDPAKLHVLGEGTAVYWPIIKQALERFGAEVQS